MVKAYNKKIVFVITDYGSFNNFLSEIAIKLARAKMDVHVITSREKVIDIEDKHDYLKCGITFHFFEFPRSFNLINHYRTSAAIQNTIKRISPDIVSLHFTTGIFTTILKQKLPFKTIGTFHGLGYPVIDKLLKKKIFKAVEFFSAGRLDEIWVLNQSDKILIEKKFPNVYLMPTNGLGCDLKIFDRKQFVDKLQPLRDELRIDPDATVISYTGRYVNFKGYDIVIKSFREMEKRNSNLKLITMGGYDKIHPTGLNEEEKNYVKDNPNIIDIGFTSRVVDYLAITDIFFFPSKKEGIPICIVEALAMEIPIVTFDARGCNDLVEDGVNGLLLPLDAQPKAFAQKIEELIKDEDTLSLMRKNIRNQRDELSRDKFVNHQLKYFCGQ